MVSFVPPVYWSLSIFPFFGGDQERNTLQIASRNICVALMCFVRIGIFI